MSEDKKVIVSAGKDVDAAVTAGLARLDLPREAVEVEVLDEGRQGMFGLGARAARVRLSVTDEGERERVAPSPAPAAAPPSRREEPVKKQVVREVRREPQAEVSAPTEAEPTEADKIRVAREAMKGLLRAMHLTDAHVEVERAESGPNEDEEPPLVIDVKGPGTDILIGSDGEVLSAFQYITRLLVGRSMQCWVHVVVDVQGYKAQRADRLRDLAHRMADQAADTDCAVILQPMPPHERRVVHVALFDDPRVTTESIYEGDRRRVTILPEED